MPTPRPRRLRTSEPPNTAAPSDGALDTLAAPLEPPPPAEAALASILHTTYAEAPSYAALIALRLLLTRARGRHAAEIEERIDAPVERMLGISVTPLQGKLAFASQEAEARERELRHGLSAMLARWDAAPRPATPAGITLFGDLFGLGEIEREAMLVLALYETNDVVAELWEPNHRSEIVELVAMATGRELASVEPCFRPSATLVRQRVFSRATRMGRASLLPGLATLLLREGVTAQDLFARFARPSAAPRATLADFAYLGKSLDAMRAYLAGALASRARGAHVLLCGGPGVGKTELARALAKDLGAMLFDVADEDGDGDPLPSEDRLPALGVAQRILARGDRAMLLFDEAEDAFPRNASEVFGVSKGSTRRKGWVHRLLEEHSFVPCVWTMNAIDHVDAATLRRFDLVFEVPAPPIAVRRALAESELEGLVEGAWIERASRTMELTPANVQRLRRVASLVRAAHGDAAGAAQGGSHATEEILSEVVRGSARALERGQAPRERSSRGEVTPYDLALLNVDVPVEALLRGLLASRSATLCFDGPPGTGKTALARHIAERLGMPLVEGSPATILAPYVGMNERNVAQLFERASREGAVLLLDEVDTFLEDRSGNDRRWETSLVNQLLVEIERFEGVFIATTNRMDRLDTAVLRRFTGKVHFAPMTAPQRESLLRRVCEGEPDPAALRELARLEGLTAGDYAAALKRLALLGEAKTAAAIVAGLVAELAAKKAGARRVVAGFR